MEDSSAAMSACVSDQASAVPTSASIVGSAPMAPTEFSMP